MHKASREKSGIAQPRTILMDAVLLDELSASCNGWAASARTVTEKGPDANARAGHYSAAMAVDSEC